MSIRAEPYIDAEARCRPANVAQKGALSKYAPMDTSRKFLLGTFELPDLFQRVEVFGNESLCAPIVNRLTMRRHQKDMARQRLSTYGLRLYRNDDGTHWLHPGENATFCVENLSHSESVAEHLRVWLQAQVPMSDQQ